MLHEIVCTWKSDIKEEPRARSPEPLFLSSHSLGHKQGETKQNSNDYTHMNAHTHTHTYTHKHKKGKKKVMTKFTQLVSGPWMRSTVDKEENL